MTSLKLAQNITKKQENDWGLFLKLAPYARKNLLGLILSFILLIPISITGAIQPLIVGESVALLQGEKTWDFLEKLPLDQGLQLLVIILLSSIVIRLIFLASQGYIVQKVGQEITAGIRQDLFNHVTSLASSFFDRTPVGRLVTRITNDVEALGDVFATGAIGIINDVVYIIVILLTIFALQWKLALMLVLMLIPVTGLIIYFQQEYRKANYKARDELSKLNSMLQENVTGINIVQLFRREQFNSELFKTVNNRYQEEVNKTIFHDSAVSSTLEWISLIAIGGVLWLGGNYVLENSLTFGTLSAFILYSQRLFNPLRQFADKFTMFQSGFTAIERITELMNETVEIQDKKETVSLQELTDNSNKELKITQDNKGFYYAKNQNNKQGEIIFDHVWFAYKNDEYVLKDLNFTIPAGQKVALVGPTGAGKSSIIRLLCRLYEPTQGRILIDGIDIRDLSQTDLRTYIGVILQESFIFAGDVKRNITLGENYPLEAIKNAAELTNVAPFIEVLPQGYDTLLRERGTNLSGGQKQLLAFARIAIRNPLVLVLDEATSSLDVGTEKLIQNALDNLLLERTAIIIAHRLSTIRNVDQILVLKKGELIESGSHDALLEQKGLYSSLYQLQMLGS
jgi:ATP-binding cassette, subfamily B, multidrug efflux pump